MKIINSFKMTVPARSANESFVRAAVAAFSAQLDPTVGEVADIKTAVSEAITNCVVHAYSEYPGNIYIVCSLTDTNELHIKIRDTGVGIENVKQAMEPAFTTVGGERSGLGFTLMESFMDKVRVRSVPNKGTTVAMIKKISPRYSLNG